MTGERIAVFLGPTLDSQRAAECLDADYLPPAEQASIVKLLLTSRPAAIVVIDGVFAKSPAVRHKEILWALSRGIPVIGAASMGALRASELHGFGMRGHGLIYRWYRATPFADDEEVAVAMTPSELGARPLSEALINMRLTFRKAERQGVIPRRMRLGLERLGASIHFLERSYQSVLAMAKGSFEAEWARLVPGLERWVGENAVDQKRIDALSLLRWLAAAPNLDLLQRAHESVPFRMTAAWLADLAASGLSLDRGVWENAQRLSDG